MTDSTPEPVVEGVTLIAEERQRQMSKKGWTPEHDRGHRFSQLARAAAVYALPEADRKLGVGRATLADVIYPYEYVVNANGEPYRVYSRWELKFGDRVRELVKAGALVAAEIDRLLAEEAE